MNGTKLDYEISERYGYELNEIRNKFSQLERGRIYELSGAQMDGYLSTNVEKIRKMLNELLSKIQNGKDGVNEELAEIMKPINI